MYKCKEEMIPSDEIVAESFFAKGVHLLDLIPQDILQANSFYFSKDPFDTAIVVMAHRMGYRLITGEQTIHIARPNSCLSILCSFRQSGEAQCD